MAWQPDHLTVRVTDNGHGMRPGARISGTGQGIIGMRERAALHQGTLIAGPARHGFCRTGPLPAVPGRTVKILGPGSARRPALTDTAIAVVVACELELEAWLSSS